MTKPKKKTYVIWWRKHDREWRIEDYKGGSRFLPEAEAVKILSKKMISKTDEFARIVYIFEDD